jgi:hypothetical protein
MNKDALMIAHNNTHSTSRIFRNVELIRRENTSNDIEKRLNAIEIACRECKEQVDKLYKIIGNIS